jgi:hypothetical protein
MELDIVLDPQQVKGEPPRRIDSPLNEKLFELIPVVYGAVLSYSLYVLAQIIIKLLNTALVVSITADELIKLVNEFINKFVVFSAIILFMMKDVGEIVKLSKDYPYTRSSRFIMEIIIACFYLMTFAFIEINSYFAIISFSVAIITGGLSQNKFKGEYLNSPSNIDALAQTQRFLHYLGGGVILFEAMIFLIKGYSYYLQWTSTLCFLSTFIFWIVGYDYWILREHGSSARHYLVNILPGRFIMSIYNKRIRKVKGEDDND